MGTPDVSTQGHGARGRACCHGARGRACRTTSPGWHPRATAHQASGADLLVAHREPTVDAQCPSVPPQQTDRACVQDTRARRRSSNVPPPSVHEHRGRDPGRPRGCAPPESLRPMGFRATRRSVTGSTRTGLSSAGRLVPDAVRPMPGTSDHAHVAALPEFHMSREGPAPTGDTDGRNPATPPSPDLAPCRVVSTPVRRVVSPRTPCSRRDGRRAGVDARPAASRPSHRRVRALVRVGWTPRP
jgi:hypothetical protein